jgi:hypothetical protein
VRAAVADSGGKAAANAADTGTGTPDILDFVNINDSNAVTITPKNFVLFFFIISGVLINSFNIFSPTVELSLHWGGMVFFGAKRLCTAPSDKRI